jgi:hypothetical protein
LVIGVAIEVTSASSSPSTISLQSTFEAAILGFIFGSPEITSRWENPTQMTSRPGLSRKAPKVSLLTLMLLIIGATSVFVYPDPQTTLSPYEDPFYPSTDGPFELAQQILSLLEASHDQVSASLDGLVDEGVVIPEGAEDVFGRGSRSSDILLHG